jgi:hypothetical protein
MLRRTSDGPEFRGHHLLLLHHHLNLLGSTGELVHVGRNDLPTDPETILGPAALFGLGDVRELGQYRSISSWSRQTNGIDSLKLKSGPPSRQPKSTPFSVHCPFRTLPFIPAK